MTYTPGIYVLPNNSTVDNSNNFIRKVGKINCFSGYHYKSFPFIYIYKID